MGYCGVGGLFRFIPHHFLPDYSASAITSTGQLPLCIVHIALAFFLFICVVDGCSALMSWVVLG
jgi:hypothetical protein